MNINLKSIYTNGTLTIIEIDNEREHKTVVLDCGSSSCNWHLDNIVNPQVIDGDSRGTFEASYNGSLKQLPLNLISDQSEKRRLIKVFQKLNSIKPNIIIISHEDADHLNLLPLFDFSELEKIICYKADCFVDRVRLLLKDRMNISNVDISDIKDINGKICLNELTNENIYSCITLYPVNWENAELDFVGGSVKNNNVGLVAVVHGNTNSAFLPGDSSPAFWTQEIIDEIINCKFVMLPHHGNHYIVISEAEKSVPCSRVGNIVLCASCNKVNQSVGDVLENSQYILISQLMGKDDRDYKRCLILDSDIKIERENDLQYYYNTDNNIFHLLFFQEYGEDSEYREVVFTL